MSENNIGGANPRLQAIERKMSSTLAARDKAIEKRIEELRKELVQLEKQSAASARVKQEISIGLSEFSGKLKNIFIQMTKGSKEIEEYRMCLTEEIQNSIRND